MPISLVLGAGATLADALYFRGQRMVESRPPLDTTFFQTVRIRGMPIGPNLRTYMGNVLGVDLSTSELTDLRMEEVFKDVFFDFVDSPTNALALGAYIDLVVLYLDVLRLTTNWLSADTRTGGPVGRLIADAASAWDEVSVITFNHDLVIENEIERRASLRRRWCLDHGYGTLGPSLSLLIPRSTGVQRFTMHSAASCDHTRPISILKLHGSLNWLARINSSRPTAAFLTGATQPRATYLVQNRQVSTWQFVRAASGGRGRTAWNLWPIVVPPVYAKQALRAALHTVWDDARSAVERAHRLVFFGYSMPLIDIESEKLFQRALNTNLHIRWIDVINPDPGTAARYAALARDIPVRWYPDVTRFLASGGSA